jgi:putative glutamine amidotransferase
MRRPLIGLTCLRQQGSFGSWSGESDFLPWDMIEKLTDAGGTPVLIAAVGEIDGGTLERFDAIVITGGGDIDPARYGAQPGPSLEDLVPDRDAIEFTLVHEALGQDIPLLGICRGHQVLAAATGGALLQDLPSDRKALHRPLPPEKFQVHEVELVDGSLLGQILGPAAAVASHHHQSIERVPEGWVVTGRAPDGLVEAIEHPDAHFAVGVQWHPEWHPEGSLFEALVQHASPRRRNGGGGDGGRPVIGITVGHELVTFSGWEMASATAPRTYADAIFAAGGQPILLPPLPGHAEQLDLLDGLLLSDGDDVGLILHGKPLAGDGADGVRDRAEMELLEGALEAGLPVLGVGRGLQLINAARDGTRIVCPSAVAAYGGHHEAGGGQDIIDTASGSRARALLGECLEVTSHDQQPIDVLGRSVRIGGRSEDGTIAAIELEDADFTIGVRWHPEDGADGRLIAALVDEAAAWQNGNR